MVTIPLVRRIAPGELPIVMDVWYRSLIGSLAGMRPEQLQTEDAYKAFFRDVVAPTRDLWVAEIGGKVAGVLALYEDEVDRLYVDPAAQRQGIGTALLRHAKSLHPQGLTLVTHQRNAGACRFYERHGFVVQQFGISPPPENEPDVMYHWIGAQQH
jgi:ribosomal protein S18 acetylase RimI-like enzyme